jgi:hypothetical protein
MIRFLPTAQQVLPELCLIFLVLQQAIPELSLIKARQYHAEGE